MISRLIRLMLMAGMLVMPASLIAQDVPNNVTVYVVQRGENLYRIALKFGLTVDALASFNGIVDPTNIQVSQRLLIPMEGTDNRELPYTHVVQAGETLDSIANLYDLTVSELVSQNKLANANVIYVGQVLTINSQTTQTPTDPPQEPTAPATVPSLVYTVQPGDTLFKIAVRFNTTVNVLVSANNITDPTLIYSGQQILVPGLEVPATALDLPLIVSAIDVTPLLFVEGETGRIHLLTNSAVSISGNFLGHEIHAASEQDNQEHTILVGVPVLTEAGIYPVDLTLTDNAGGKVPFEVNVRVLPGQYGQESITLGPNLSDLLDPNVEGPEQAILQRVMGGFTATRYFEGVMSLPAAASVISPFGRIRSYNGGPFDRFHAGTDFAGAPGTSVLASASGYVVLADNLHVRGLATIIDHGWGVYTGYWHQSQQFVKVGDFVVAGQVIGTIGSTGRVTGPHLHWEMWVNGVPVNPMQWLQVNFS
ncbi:MAG: LysM peptidoglycan-binding domain-containing protein [Anaerolineae bacterium]